MQSTLPDNRTIQDIVRDYVEDYVGRYPMACNMSVSLKELNAERTPFIETFLH